MNGLRDERLNWRDAVSVELVDGYTIANANGVLVGAVTGAAIGIEGGFVHVEQSGCAVVHIVSAPAVRRITYRPL